jgi:hypothetical protein
MVQAQTMHARWVSLLCLVALASCERCSGRVPEELRVTGPTPYVRCLGAPPVKARKWRFGRAEFDLNERDLTIGGLPDAIRMAVFSGPAFVSESPAAALKKVAAARPRLALVLGGVGDDRDTALRTLRLLGDLDFPCLVIGGGRDRWSDLRTAFDALEEGPKDRVIDATPLQTVRLGRDTLVLVAGAAHGRYARDGFACGFGDPDLDKIASEIGPKKDERRWLVSWQAPAGEGALAVAKTSRGVQTGDGSLGRFAKRVGALGGLFAWPDLQVMRPRAHGESLPLPPGVAADDLRIVAPRLVGPAIEREDGSRAMPGFALVVLTKAGMLVEEH